jgi:transposase-like protein
MFIIKSTIDIKVKMPPTQSRRSYTAAFKLEVAIYAEENGGNMAAQRKYGVSEKVIRGWRKQKETLRSGLCFHWFN